MATIESLQAQIIALQASEAKLTAEVEELTAENEKLTDDIDDAVENHFADLKLRETTHKEWDTLEEENDVLKADQVLLEGWLEDAREQLGVLEEREDSELEKIGALEYDISENQREHKKENKKITDHRDRILKKMRRQTKDNDELKAEFDDYVHRHPCEMVCRHCNIITTEDDLGISLDCGELTCESCFEEGKSKSLKD